MAEMDHFERLGLPRRFALDQVELERNYLAKSREVHPDHAGEEAGDDAARLNQAYASLKDDWRRADYLMSLLGGPGANAVKQPPPEFLEEMLELRMAMAEARADADANASMKHGLERRKREIMNKVGTMLDGPISEPELIDIRQQLNAVKFLSGLLRDLNEE